MKTSFKYLVVGLFAMCTAFTACEKDEVVPRPANNNGEMINSITQGVWEVMTFIDDGIDKKAHFRGFLFEFRSSGEVLAIRMGDTYTGKWRLISPLGSDQRMFIDFGAQVPFNEMNRDWKITAPVTSTIALEDDNAQNSGKNQLVFERN